MFNTYQELVDRIEELLKEREKKDQKLKRFITIFSKIPKYTINNMYNEKAINKEERIFWEILQRRKENVSNNNKN